MATNNRTPKKSAARRQSVKPRGTVAASTSAAPPKAPVVPMKLSAGELKWALAAFEVLHEKKKPKPGETTVSKGIHVVIDGFNDAIRAKFPYITDMTAFSAGLVVSGKFVVTKARLGAMLYLKGDEPQSVRERGDVAAKMTAVLGEIDAKVKRRGK